MAIIANPSVAALYEDALVYETGSAMTDTGALTAYSGAKTGRSPSDKRVVKEPGSEKDIWWGPVNKEMSPEVSPLFHYTQSTSAPRSEVFLQGQNFLQDKHDVLAMLYRKPDLKLERSSFCCLSSKFAEDQNNNPRKKPLQNQMLQHV